MFAGEPFSSARETGLHFIRNEKDAIGLIRKKEIYELLEATTDRCEDVADVIQNVSVKNN